MTLRISRNWATPLTIGAFALMAVTGVLMFFHLDQGLNKLAHEWLGWLMVAGVALHAAANGMAFKRHLIDSRAGRAIVVVSLLVLGASFFSLPGGGSQEAPPPVLAMRAVLSAPLTRVAALTGAPAEDLLTRLKAGGIALDSTDQSIASVSQGDRGVESKALNLLFAAR